MHFRRFSFFITSFSFLFCAISVRAQMGNSGSIDGVVKDSSGGIVAGATVDISYPVSGYQRQATTGSDGAFRFTNVPFNTYHLVVTTPGFAPYTQDVDVRSTVPTSIQIGLKLGTAATSITVNITSQNTSVATTRVGLKCVPERSTAWITPPLRSISFRWMRRSARATPFCTSLARR